MLMIRLARHGAKKKPFYHIVAIDKRRARNAICKEKLGFYHPMEKYAQLNLERMKHWLSVGAKCSESVSRLVKKYESGELKPHQPAKKVTLAAKNKKTGKETTAKLEKDKVTTKKVEEKPVKTPAHKKANDKPTDASKKPSAKTDKASSEKQEAVKKPQK